jgi:hypothetical protein
VSQWGGCTQQVGLGTTWQILRRNANPEGSARSSLGCRTSSADRQPDGQPSVQDPEDPAPWAPFSLALPGSLARPYFERPDSTCWKSITQTSQPAERGALPPDAPALSATGSELRLQCPRCSSDPGRRARRDALATTLCHFAAVGFDDPTLWRRSRGGDGEARRHVLSRVSRRQ